MYNILSEVINITTPDTNKITQCALRMAVHTPSLAPSHSTVIMDKVDL